MRKILAVAALIGLGVALYYYFGYVMPPKTGMVLIPVTEEKLLENIMTDYDGYLEEIENVRKLPEQLAQMTCMLTRLLYSGMLDETQMEAVFKFQREFYDEDTLEKNPEADNFIGLKENVSKFSDVDLKVIGYKMDGSQYVPAEGDSPPLMIFYVIYYLNINAEGSEVYKGYVFEQNEDKTWDLKGFETVDSFPTIAK